jgi:preprotein translocase SecE subunit
MASVRDEKSMASNVIASGAGDDESSDREKRPALPPPKKSTASGPAFFTIYKKGQGKWTRMGTAFVAGILGCLTAYNLYLYAQPFLPIEHPETARKFVVLACVLFLAGFSLLAFWLSNKPRNVDFLIATDSEMKKVNWTTKGELFGSTRVVVLFLVFIAVFLFLVDVIFDRFFHLIGVLK